MNKEPKNRQELTRMNGADQTATRVERCSALRSSSSGTELRQIFRIGMPHLRRTALGWLRMATFILVNELRNKYELSES
jgi:hypothetical protein